MPTLLPVLAGPCQRLYIQPGPACLRDERRAHRAFQPQWTGEKYELFVEVFSPEGELTGFGPVNEFEGFQAPRTGGALEVVWKDELDRFYWIDRSRYPLLRVTTLSIIE